MQIDDESGPFGDFERELAKQLPNWEQDYAHFDIEGSDFVKKKEFESRFANFKLKNLLVVHFSAILRVPSTVKSAALTAPPPIALYEDGERVVDVERALCLTSLPSVTGVVSVPKAWRIVRNNALDKSWLARMRNTLIERLCAQLEELEDTEHTAILSAFKPQFCVR